jgi:hypothetical protein
MGKKVGYHADPVEIRHPKNASVSVGIRPILPNGRQDPRLGAVVVRVVGPNAVDSLGTINTLVQMVIDRLDSGTYDGPKRLTTDSLTAWNMFMAQGVA